LGQNAFSFQGEAQQTSKTHSGAAPFEHHTLYFQKVVALPSSNPTKLAGVMRRPNGKINTGRTAILAILPVCNLDTNLLNQRSFSSILLVYAKGSSSSSSQPKPLVQIISSVSIQMISIYGFSNFSASIKNPSNI
jgi:hypothetical protein